MLSTLMMLVGLVPEVIKDGTSAYSAVKAFLASPAGQQLEADLAKLFTHVATRTGSTVVVEPIPTVAGGKAAAVAAVDEFGVHTDAGVPSSSRGR